MKYKLLILFFFGIFLSSCDKKEIETVPVIKNTYANIYVKDETNASVQGAMVILYGTVTSNQEGTNQPILQSLNDTLYTNSSGLASFNLGKIGGTILDIKSRKLNKLGTGIIQIVPELVNEETIFIQP